MKRFLPYYYLLFVLLIMGAFASMAQNDYGQFILGAVAIAFALLFSVQLFLSINQQENKWQELTEMICLITISVIMALRVFYIYFKGIELIFLIASGLLMSIYILRLLQVVYSSSFNNIRAKGLILVFYSSLILFILAMIAVQFFPSRSFLIGYVAFGLLVLFMTGSWVSKAVLLEGEKMSGIQIVSRLNDKSVLLISLFLLFSLYTGFTSIGLLPRMYSNEYPQAYYRLLANSRTQGIPSTDLRKKQEEFKKKYDALVKKQLKNIQ